MGPRLSRRHALLGSTTLLATPFLGSLMAQAQEVAAINASPLLDPWPGGYGGTPPWDKFAPAMFPPAFEVAMGELRSDVLAIRDAMSAPSFATVVLPMESTGEKMDRVQAAWGVYISNLATKEVQAINREWSPKRTKFYDELYLDPKLFARVKAAYDGRAAEKLDPQQLRLLTRTYRSFVRRGAALSDAQRAEVSRLNQALSAAFSDFNRKLLADEETWTVLAAGDLAGLPASYTASLKAAAEERKLAGWAVVNTRSAVEPFLTASTNRPLREKIWRAFVMRGDNGGANDSKAVIAEILKLRQQRAVLLGFKSHAYYRMDDTMAETPANAMKLMTAVWPAARARVAEEVADMQAIADKEGAGIKIEPWDYRFYAEKVRKDRYDLDETQVKPYFELGNILDGAFYAAGRLYDFDFKPVTDVPVFDPAVRTFEVTDKKTGKNIGIFYFDGYARSGKGSGAWATRYRGQQEYGGHRNVLASNNNNFVKGGAGEPTLISLEDARTLFHEFGHALHSFAQNITYAGLAGTPRDFVEYPSQVNENWLLTRDVLDRYAKHYKTGEPIPSALVDKIQKSATFNQGFKTVEALACAILDMQLHDRETPVSDVAAFEKQALATLGMPSEIALRHRLPQFGHLFSSDAYSAGYYSYLWSETMDADTWAAFEETGDVWDRKTADRFRATLLSTGNETDRKAAYREFRGRDPDVKALFKRRGFPVS